MSLEAAFEHYTQQEAPRIRQVAARSWLEEVCAAYRELGPVITNAEAWLASNRAEVVRLWPDPFKRLQAAIGAQEMQPPDDVLQVHIYRLAGWSFKAIAGEFQRSPRWIQILDRRWRESFGTVVSHTDKGEVR